MDSLPTELQTIIYRMAAEKAPAAFFRTTKFCYGLTRWHLVIERRYGYCTIEAQFYCMGHVLDKWSPVGVVSIDHIWNYIHGGHGIGKILHEFIHNTNCLAESYAKYCGQNIAPQSVWVQLIGKLAPHFGTDCQRTVISVGQKIDVTIPTNH